MIIDKNGKIFGKISIIDLFILLVIIAAAAFLFLKFSGLAGDKANITEKSYTVMINSIKEDTASYLKTGEKLYDDKGSFLGVIEDIKLQPSEVVKTLDNGNYVVAENPERVDAVLTIKGKGFTSGGIFYLDGKVSLLVGTERFFKGNRVDFEGNILKIND